MSKFERYEFEAEISIGCDNFSRPIYFILLTPPFVVPEACLSTTNHHDDQSCSSKAQSDVEDDISPPALFLQVIIELLLQAVNLLVV